MRLTKSTMKLVDEMNLKNFYQLLKLKKQFQVDLLQILLLDYLNWEMMLDLLVKLMMMIWVKNMKIGLKKKKLKYFYKKKRRLPTGTCLILITPDAERTMCTFLGTAGKINENDIDENAVKESEMIFLEGYLWDEGEPKSAFDKAINNFKKSNVIVRSILCRKT